MIKKEDLKIVFMGTPEFAVESLKAIVENGYHVVGVVTVPDKPAGRGQKTNLLFHTKTTCTKLTHYFIKI